MRKIIHDFFGINELGTSIGRESLAGMTTFVTMAYIIVVNPKILEAAGIPFGASMMATILTAFFGTMFMGLYAKRPFAVAPYMGENAFIAFTVVQVMGYSWETALGAIFISGVGFTIITLVGVREWLARSIPYSLKLSFAVGIGLFLAFIGLTNTGLVVLGSPGSPVHMGDLSQPSALLAIGGFFLTAMLMAWRVRGAIILSILTVTGAAFVFGVATPPTQMFSMPPSLSETFLKLDIAGALTWGCFSVILTVLVLDFVDTMGTIYAVAGRADLLDEHGDLPELRKPMLVDATTTVVASMLGTTSSGVFVESATGIEDGGRSGLTAVVTALLFLVALFLAPLLEAVPACAYGPSLIVVGMLMLSSMKDLDMSDVSESVPSFFTVVLMSFTYNIGVGMTAGFVAYPVMKLVTGRFREIGGCMWFLAVLSVLFFVFYPS